jgi:hypothetical protein
VSRPRVVVCYSLDSTDPAALDDLRRRLAVIGEGAAAAGCETYAHIRDGQQWRLDGADAVGALRAVLHELHSCDAVLLDLTPHGHSRFTGLAIEAGYAISLGRPIAAVWPGGTEPPRMLRGIATSTAVYAEPSDLQSAVRLALAELVAAEPRAER